MEDIQGDIDFDCNTLPIYIGIRGSKLVTILLILIHLAFLAGIQVYYLEEQLTSRIIYIGATLELPLLYTLWAVWFAKKRKDYGLISNIIKGVMLAGILSMALFTYF